MDHHQDLAFRFLVITMAIEMKAFGKINIQVLCMGSMGRLF